MKDWANNQCQQFLLVEKIKTNVLRWYFIAVQHIIHCGLPELHKNIETGTGLSKFGSYQIGMSALP